MGHLIYGAGTEFAIDDRTLAHMRVIILSKLRVQECFLVNWSLAREDGSGRMSIWVSPGIPMQFRFSRSRTPELNQAWLRALMDSAQRSTGMIVMPESEAESSVEPVPAGQAATVARTASHASGAAARQRAAKQRSGRAPVMPATEL